MEQATQTRLKPLHLEMMELATGHFRAQAICTAAVLGIPDLLKEGPKGVEELGRASGTQPQALYRLLRALPASACFNKSRMAILH
ncbi:MAG: methyltransferase dimerization domain-containing protein [Rhodospirillales bacterium]